MDPGSESWTTTRQTCHKWQESGKKQESIAFIIAERVQPQALQRMTQDIRASNVVLVLLLTTAAIWEVTYSPPYTNSSRVSKNPKSCAILFFFKLVSFLPERGRSSRSVNIVVPNIYYVSKSLTPRILECCILVEPISQHAPSRTQPTDLDPFRPPSFLAVENRERRPSDLTFGGLPHGTSFRISFSFLSCFDSHQITAGVLTSDLAISIRVPRSMKTLGRPSKMHNRQPRPSEIAPVQPFIFVVVAVAVGRLFDLGNVPLDADQSDS